MTVAGVVLGAGAGRRMGQPKAGLLVDGVPLVRRAVSALRDGGCDPIAVVVGAGAPDTGGLVADMDVTVLQNPDWRIGMSTSVVLALRWASGTTAEGVLVLPVDTPGIGPAVVDRLCRVFGEAPVDGVVPTYSGLPRNPALLAREVLDEVVESLSGDRGARMWLTANADRLRMVACDDVGDPTDLDTPADLARWTAASRHDPDTD